MAKQSGLGWTTLSVDDASGTPRDIRNDITNLQFATPRAVQEVTGIDKSAIERLLLLADFSVTLNVVFNSATNQSHDVFKTVPSTSVARTVSIGVGGKTLTNEVLFTDYPVQRSDSGELTASVPGSLADGTVPTWG
jgi:acetaldehyde dehydrogenase (acetylating)